MVYQGQAGHTYTFLALATDVAGNHEQPPARANVPQDTTTVNLGALPTVPSTTPPNFGIPPAPVVQPSTNPLFTQAQQDVPAAPPSSDPSEFQTVLQPFTGPVVRHRLRPERRHHRPDGDRRQRPTATSWSAAAPARNELFLFPPDGGRRGTPLATLPYQIYDMAFDTQGNLWATTGGGPLLQLDPTTGAIVDQFGDSITLALAVDPSTGRDLRLDGQRRRDLQPRRPTPSRQFSEPAGRQPGLRDRTATSGRSPGPTRPRSSSSSSDTRPQPDHRVSPQLMLQLGPTSSRSPSG